jgi:predicted phage-related endonuclease
VIPTIGASEIAVCLGLQQRKRDGTPYTSELELWARLRGLIPRYDSTSSPAADAGHDMEPGIGMRYARERNLVWGQDIAPGPQLPAPGLSHPDLAWLSVRPDFLVPGLQRGLEAKAPREIGDTWGPPGTDEIPPWYLVQALAQLAVEHRLFGWTEQDVAARARDTWDRDRAWGVWTVRRDEAVERGMLARAHDWYRRHVEDGKPPVGDGSESATSTLVRIWTPADDLAVEADAADVEHMQALLSIRSAIDELEARKREHEQALQARLGEATALVQGRRKLATWRARKGATRIDLGRLRRERPDIVNTYAETGTAGRTWRIE